MKNSDLPEDADQFIRHFVDNRFWKFAKTYAKSTPHSYTVREWQPDKDDDFVKAVLIIREYGKVEKFYSKSYIYLYLDGLKYWTMGNPLDDTTVINRADWNTFYGYR